MVRGEQRMREIYASPLPHCLGDLEGWGDDSVSNVLAIQALGTRFGHQNLGRKARHCGVRL